MRVSICTIKMNLLDNVEGNGWGIKENGLDGVAQGRLGIRTAVVQK